MKDSASVQELLTDIVDLKLDPRTAAASILSSLNGNAEKAGSKTK